MRDEIESINYISINLPQSTKFSKCAPARTIVLAAIGKIHAKATFTLSGRGSDINYNGTFLSAFARSAQSLDEAGGIYRRLI